MCECVTIDTEQSEICYIEGALYLREALCLYVGKVSTGSGAD